MILNLLCAAILVSLEPVGRAQTKPAEPAPTFPSRVTMELQAVGLPRKAAIPLIRKLRSGEDKDRHEALANLAKMVDGGMAKLYGWPVVNSVSEQKATTGETEEVRFVREFEPAVVNLHFGEDAAAPIQKPQELKGTEAAPVAKSFDMRTIGLILECQADVDPNGQQMRVTFTAQHTRLKSIDRSTIEREDAATGRKEKIVQEQPRFAEMKVANSYRQSSGEAFLVGVFTLPDNPDELELFIFTATVSGKK